jgi:hypothetical protein
MIQNDRKENSRLERISEESIFPAQSISPLNYKHWDIRITAPGVAGSACCRREGGSPCGACASKLDANSTDPISNLMVILFECNVVPFIFCC